MQPPSQPQPPQAAITPQQAAIRTLRDRYEAGDIPVEVFKQALDALLEARDADECQEIIRALPVSHAEKLKALDLPATVAVPASLVPAAPAKRRGMLVMLLGELNRGKRRWALAEHTTGLMALGEMNLDLTSATLPRRASLHLFGMLGEITVRVPRSVAVRVHSLVLLGEANALGEGSGGIFAMGNAESHGPDAASDGAPEPTAYLDIYAFMGLGEITIKQADAPAVSIAEAPPAAMLPQPS